MSDKHNIFHSQFVLVIKDGRRTLVPASATARIKYEAFINSMEEGQKADLFGESHVDNGTVTQIAKAHVCIRELAKHLGYSFQEMKFEIKRLSGLCVEKNVNGNKFLVCKSLADCSVDEMTMVIQAIIELGDENGMNFR